jgi:cholesterol transport system auxiliary component
MPATPRSPTLKPRLFALTAATAAAAVLSACAASPTPASKAVYDFGPVRSIDTGPAAPAFPSALALAEIDTSLALDNTAVHYRLAYANPQALRPYALARWTMPPAQLIEQLVRSALTARGPVLKPGDGSPVYTLKLELEEFSHVFDAPGASQGLAQLRATLLKGNALAAQRTFSAQARAPTADAAGGVNALSTAAQEIARQLAAWTGDNMR